MLTLTSTLLAEQRKASYIPYVRLWLPNYGGGTDLAPYYKKLLHTEQTYGGGSSILFTDLESWFFSSGKPIDFKGQEINIGLGFVTDAGKEYKTRGPVWVYNTRLSSYEGVLAVQFECLDMWEKLGMLRAAGNDLGTALSWEGDTTIYAIIGELLSGITALTKDSSDGVIDVFQPYYYANINDSKRDIIVPLMGLTKCGMRMRSDGMHIFKLVEQSGGTDSYTYELGGDHTFFSCLEDDEITVPNKIIVVDDYDEVTYTGTAIDTNSYGDLGYYVPRAYAIPGISSNAEATQFAEAILCCDQRSVSRGLVRVPLNCGAELFDYAVVVDKRWPS